MSPPDDLPDLDNPRDEDGRILCPVCRTPITGAESVFRAGNEALHFRCHERREEESAGGAPRPDRD